MKIIKTIAIATTAVLGLGFTVPVFADGDICGNNNVSAEVRAAAGCETGANVGQLDTTIVGILNGIIAVLGLLAVVFVIIGGVQYITSTGDAGKLKKAKDTILYALIGLAICVLSFAFVNFFIVKIIAGE